MPAAGDAASAVGAGVDTEAGDAAVTGGIGAGALAATTSCTTGVAGSAGEHQTFAGVGAAGAGNGTELPMALKCLSQARRAPESGGPATRAQHLHRAQC